MFTGIVEETGEVRATQTEEGGRRLRIAAGFTPTLDHGQSISVNGVCLTVETIDSTSFEVFLAMETLSRTYLDQLDPGSQVNLERALTPADRLDGHVVQGHVDATSEVLARRPVETGAATPPGNPDSANRPPSVDSGDWEFVFSLPPGVGRYVVEKGSIAVDGISLTVAERSDGSFTTAVIPATYDLTTLDTKDVGDPVHLEVDILAKYVERLMNADGSTG